MLKDFKHLFKHSAIYGVSNILGKAIGFLMIPVYTRYIAPQDYGILEILDVSISVVGMFVGMGISNAVARFYYLFDSVEEKKKVISSAIFFMTVCTALFSLLGWLLAAPLSTLLFASAAFAPLVTISLLTFAFNAVLEIPLTYLQALEKSAIFGVAAIGRLLLALSLNIYCVVYLRLGISGILYSGIITSAVFALVLAIWTLNRTGWRFDAKIQGQMLKFGAPLIFHRLGMFLINWGDRYFLNAFAGLQAVGVYALGYKFGFMLSFLVGQPFFLIWSIRRYSLIAEENGEKTYGQIFFAYALLLFFAWLGLSLFAEEIIILVADRRYLEAYRIIPWVALGYVFREFADFFNGMLYIEHKTSKLGLITVLVALFCLGNYAVLIPTMHSMGAALSTLSTFVFMAILTWWNAERTRKIDYRLKGCLAGGLLALSLWLIGVFSAALCSGPALLAVKLLLFCTFPAMCFAVLLSASERAAMAGLLMTRRLRP